MASRGFNLLAKLGIQLSPEHYGDKSLFVLFWQGIRLWKNEILHKLARHSVILVPAPLAGRLCRPMLHRWRGVEVGKDVFIGLDVLLDSRYPELIHIGAGSMLTSGVTIYAHNRDVSDYKVGDRVLETGFVIRDVVIEDDVMIGTGSIILPGVHIGKGAVIGAGSVVNKNVEPYTFVAGIPAKVIKEYRE